MSDGQGWLQIRDRMRDYVARRVSSSADVDDVLQEALVRLARRAAAGAAGAEEEPAPALVLTAAKSAVIDFYRRRAARGALRERAAREPAALSGAGGDPLEVGDFGGFGDFVAPGESGEDSAAVRELAGCLRPFVDELPAPFRAAVSAVDLGGQTQAAAARAEGVPLTTMKSRVQKGRALLRARIEACCAVALDARGRPMEAPAITGGCAPAGTAPGAGSAPSCCR
jgi:RNA polymerase sigma-70 factor, ECF subfamily